MKQFGESPTSEAKAVRVDGELGDLSAEAIDCVIDRNYAVVYGYAYRLTGCSAAAEDISQETFLKAVKSYGQLRAQGAERAWLLSITRHEFGRWLRKQLAPGNKKFESCDLDIAASDERSSSSDDHDWLQSALQQIDADFRKVVLMFYFEELSYAEIAQQLQIPIGTVMSRLSRSRVHLRAELEKLASKRCRSAKGTSAVEAQQNG